MYIMDEAYCLLSTQQAIDFPSIMFNGKSQPLIVTVFTELINNEPGLSQ